MKKVSTVLCLSLPLFSHYPTSSFPLLLPRQKHVIYTKTKTQTEQENLIRNLRAQNENLNTQYTRILLLLPLVCILPYLSTLASQLSLLSISSLLSTAYLVFSLPSGETGIFFLDTLNGERDSDGGPIKKYLPYLNLALCGALVVLGKLKREEWWILSWLPLGVQGIVLCGKWVMGGVDPGRELEGLRYGYKGA